MSGIDIPRNLLKAAIASPIADKKSPIPDIGIVMIPTKGIQHMSSDTTPSISAVIPRERDGLFFTEIDISVFDLDISRLSLKVIVN